MVVSITVYRLLNKIYHTSDNTEDLPPPNYIDKKTAVMEEYVDYASTKQLPTLIAISLILGLGKGGVPGVATMATAATVLTAPTHIDNGLGYAVALMVPILTMIDIFAAYLHR